MKSIHETLAFLISKSTVRRRIQSSKFNRYHRMRLTPILKLHHRKARVLWAKKYMHWTNEWLNVFFSDEKKFNVDGPDDWAYYWHYLWREPREFFSRQKGGGVGRVPLQRNKLHCFSWWMSSKAIYFQIEIMRRFTPRTQQQLSLLRIKWLL